MGWAPGTAEGPAGCGGAVPAQGGRVRPLPVRAAPAPAARRPGRREERGERPAERGPREGGGGGALINAVRWPNPRYGALRSIAATKVYFRVRLIKNYLQICLGPAPHFK